MRVVVAFPLLALRPAQSHSCGLLFDRTAPLIHEDDVDCVPRRPCASDGPRFPWGFAVVAPNWSREQQPVRALPSASRSVADRTRLAPHPTQQCLGPGAPPPMKRRRSLRATIQRRRPQQSCQQHAEWSSRTRRALHPFFRKFMCVTGSHAAHALCAAQPRDAQALRTLRRCLLRRIAAIFARTMSSARLGRLAFAFRRRPAFSEAQAILQVPAIRRQRDTAS